MFRLFAIALPAYALDQLTKYLVNWYIPYDPMHVRWDEKAFFQLVHWGNTGAAFSFMSDNNRFFIGLSVVAFITIVTMQWRGAFRDAPSAWGAALLLGGILGNVTDRLVHGHVVDFLLFNLGIPFADPWPAFNVADSCICVAVGLFLIASFREGRQQRTVVETRG